MGKNNTTVRYYRNAAIAGNKSYKVYANRNVGLSMAMAYKLVQITGILILPHTSNQTL